mmetsp:Transcript_18266/g.31248  ORF Transcript_18266/g.31248 Transcript_18266/m.31248 type:complete len:464 (-) Transcript_18266:43-1434(-)
MQETFKDPSGKPVIDEEGGAVVQPEPGFVIKTRDLKDKSKVFLNFTHHELVESFEEKPIPKEDAAKLGSSEKGLRIPLSLGDVREDSDKKGDPVQVYDFIWNPDTVKNAQKDPAFRQIMVELALNYIKQKFDRDLDIKFTVPKMKYKGATVQFQRIRAKKGPKIQEVQMTEEEKQRLQQKAIDEQMRREALREKEPKWKLYCIMHKRLNQELSREEYLKKLVDEAFDNDCVGDQKDRWAYLKENFEIKQQFDVLEEFDGLNDFEAEGLLMVVNLEFITRGHAIQAHILNNRYLQVQVPSMYHVAIGLPIEVDETKVRCYFDCKIRRCFIHMSKLEEEEEEEEEAAAPTISQPKQLVKADDQNEEENLLDDIIEIDTSKHFGKDVAPQDNDLGGLDEEEETIINPKNTNAVRSKAEFGREDGPKIVELDDDSHVEQVNKEDEGKEDEKLGDEDQDEYDLLYDLC